jgi:hypothetical protein
MTNEEMAKGLLGMGKLQLEMVEKMKILMEGGKYNEQKLLDMYNQFNDYIDVMNRTIATINSNIKLLSDRLDNIDQFMVNKDETLH